MGLAVVIARESDVLKARERERLLWLRREDLVQRELVVDAVGELPEDVADLGLEQRLQLRRHVLPVLVQEKVHRLACGRDSEQSHLSLHLRL